MKHLQKGERYDIMRKKDLEGKIVVGEFANSQKQEFTENIERISEEKFGKKTLRKKKIGKARVNKTKPIIKKILHAGI